MLHSDDSRVASPQNTSAEETREAQFLDDCRFAKVVRVGDADALLIGGAVILVEGPGTGVLSSQFSLGQKSWADRLATALRKIDVRQTGDLSYGTLGDARGAACPSAPGGVHEATSAFVDNLNLRGQIEAANALDRTEGPDLIVARLEKRIEALENYAQELGRTDATIVTVVNRCAEASGVCLKIEPRDVSLS